MAAAAAGAPVVVHVGEERGGYVNVGVDLPAGRRTKRRPAWCARPARSRRASRDQHNADRWIQGRAHIHLFGHVHEHDSEDGRSGAGTGLLRIAAGATYGNRPGVPASHGYSIAAVVPQHDGTLRLRIWPRRWSETKRFVADVHNTPEGRAYAEHPLPGLRAPG